MPPPTLLARRDDAELVLSEVVSNAVQHGSIANDSIRLMIENDEDGLRVEVGQVGSVSEIHLVEPRFIAVTGRGYGLQMVAALTDSWGTGTEPDRHVWFEFRIHTN